MTKHDRVDYEWLLRAHTRHVAPSTTRFAFLEPITQTIRDALLCRLSVHIALASTPEQYPDGEFIIFIYDHVSSELKDHLKKQYNGYYASLDDLRADEFGVDNEARKRLLRVLDHGEAVYLIPNTLNTDGVSYSIAHIEIDD